MTQVQRTGTSTARVLAIISFVCSAIALFFLPPLFGLAAIVLGIISHVKGDRLGMWAWIVGVVALIAGMALAAAVMSALRS